MLRPPLPLEKELGTQYVRDSVGSVIQEVSMKSKIPWSQGIEPRKFSSGKELKNNKVSGIYMRVVLNKDFGQTF
jgi:hypothetical protein